MRGGERRRAAPSPARCIGRARASSRRTEYQPQTRPPSQPCFSCCSAVAGVDRYPRKVTRAMTKEKVTKRSKVKPFVKYINYTHLMPTRYVVDIDLKKIVEQHGLKENRSEARKEIKKIFEDRYLNQASVKSEKKASGVSYFFKKLRF